MIRLNLTNLTSGSSSAYPCMNVSVMHYSVNKYPRVLIHWAASILHIHHLILYMPSHSNNETAYSFNSQFTPTQVLTIHGYVCHSTVHYDSTINCIVRDSSSKQ